MRLQKIATLARQYRYETIAVLNGAAIMVLEIVGSRIVAPAFGNSVYVWTAVIGVILAAMSLGYWYGGRLADRTASDAGLSILLLGASVTLFVSLVIKEASLGLAAAIGADLRFQALVAATLIFAPANFLMGMVSPYLAKLRITTLDTAGASVGRLYAAGTAGSIIGTFAAGYWLIALLGNRALGLSLVILLIGASLLADRRFLLWPRLAVAAMVLIILWVPAARQQGILYDGDSAYSRYQVADFPSKDGPKRLLMMDHFGFQSGILVKDPNRIVFDYVQRFVDVSEHAGAVNRVLLIGGGAYTLPRAILAKHPQAHIDVVEIDPKLDQLSERYFGFKVNQRIRIIHQDGRTFLNSNHTKYDLIYMDAFSSETPPFQLTTSEAVARLRSSLNPDGVVALNMLSTLAGKGSAFAGAELATYRSHFAHVAAGPVVAATPEDVLQNILAVAGANKAVINDIAQALTLKDVPASQPGALVLTDDFAPVEQLMARR